MGKLSSKPRKSIKLTPGQATQLAKALSDLKAQYGDIVANWKFMTERQNLELQTNSQILSDLISFTEPFRT